MSLTPDSILLTVSDSLGEKWTGSQVSTENTEDSIMLFTGTTPSWVSTVVETLGEDSAGMIPRLDGLGKLDFNMIIQPSDLDHVTVPVPAEINSTGTKGTIAFDEDYLYVCVAQNKWRRVQLFVW